MASKVDNIIIGAGPAGYELAAHLAEKGESVIIAERDSLGGTCLNRGCIPTKTLLASAGAVLKAQAADALGVEIEGIKIDYPRVAQRVKDVVDNLRENVGTLLTNCEVKHGEAVMESNKTVRIGNEIYEANRIVIATGSAPVLLPIPGAEYAITSDQALWLEKLPESVVIIGGGVIGIELATIYSAFGVKTTVLEFCKEILPPFDADLAKRLRSILTKRGIEIITGASAKSIDKHVGDYLSVCYVGKKGENTVDGEKVIIATGRKPVVPKGFDEIGGRVNARGFIEVDDMMRTSVAGVYAIGDVNGLSMLAHSAYAQGRVIAYGDPTLFNANRVPSIVYSYPEIASVGLTPSQLDNTNITYRTVKRPFASNGKANAEGHTEGFVKFVCDENDVILGISIIGAAAADLVAEATILVTERIKLCDVQRKFIHAHPTLSEIFC